MEAAEEDSIINKDKVIDLAKIRDKCFKNHLMGSDKRMPIKAAGTGHASLAKNHFKIQMICLLTEMRFIKIKETAFLIIQI